MRCPNCNAHNADGATFCTLCHTSFTSQPSPDPAPVADEPTDAVAPPRADPAGLQDPALTPPPAVRTSNRGTFRRTVEGFDWRCARCLEWNPLELTTCSVCKLPFRDTMSPSPDRAPVELSQAMALGLSAVAPGLAHVAARRSATGTMRLMLFALFFGGGLLLQAQANRTEGAPLLAVPLLLGAVTVWTATMVDAQRLATGRDESVLSTRTYLWMLVVVLVLSLTAALPAIFRAARPADDLGPGLGQFPVGPTTTAPATQPSADDATTPTGGPSAPGGESATDGAG